MLTHNNTVYVINRNYIYSQESPIKAVVFRKETDEASKEIFWHARNPKTRVEYRFSEKRIGLDIFLSENDAWDALRAAKYEFLAVALNSAYTAQQELAKANKRTLDALKTVFGAEANDILTNEFFLTFYKSGSLSAKEDTLKIIAEKLSNKTTEV